MKLQADIVNGIYEVEDFSEDCKMYISSTVFYQDLPFLKKGELVGVEAHKSFYNFLIQSYNITLL